MRTFSGADSPEVASSASDQRLFSNELADETTGIETADSRWVPIVKVIWLF